MTNERRKFYFGLLILTVLFILTALLCLNIGRYHVPLRKMISVLVNFRGSMISEPKLYSVVFKIRLPRILLAAFVGAGLSIAGASFQALFSNPLATPDTLGVASGASFGAVVALLFSLNALFVQLFALVTGIAALFLTYVIGNSNGKNGVKSGIIMIILAGMAVSSLFQAAVSLAKYLADTEEVLPAITFWLMGSMASAKYGTLVIGLPFIAVGMILLWSVRWRLNILSFSEDEARSLGVNVKAVRLITMFASTLITASAVSMCGQVGWVGLLVPHIARMLFGNNNSYVVPASIGLGAVLMILIDTAARSLISSEIPVSILTAALGAPLFIFLLKKTGGIRT